ncbi:hypothetical protein YC2023_028624 [Brassica napus]
MLSHVSNKRFHLFSWRYRCSQRQLIKRLTKMRLKKKQKTLPTRFLMRLVLELHLSYHQFQKVGSVQKTAAPPATTTNR